MSNNGFGRDPIPGMDDDADGGGGGDDDEGVAIAGDAPVATQLPPVATPAAPAAAPVTALRVLNGPCAGRTLRLAASDGRWVLGRGDPQQQPVEFDLADAEMGDPPMISRRHALLERDSATGAITLTDLGSTNGTWLDDARLPAGARSAPLTPRARVRLANIDLEALAEPGSDPAAPPPPGRPHP